MQKQKALTIVEILTAVIIIAVIACILANVVGGCVNRGPQAEQEMREYIAKLYPNKEIIGVFCTNVDTDQDGYISCVATIDTDTGPEVVEKQISAQCATQLLGWNSGCKPTVGMMPQY